MAFGKNKKKQANKLEIDEARARRQAERPRKGGAPIIELRDVSKVYSGGHLAVDRVSLAIGRGEFVFLVGPTGCGKSTLIKLLIRELEPSDGTVSIAGRDIGQLSDKKIPQLRRNIATLPITLYPGMKIGQISFLMMTTPADVPYGSAAVGSKYQGQRGPTPSRYWENFKE